MPTPNLPPLGEIKFRVPNVRGVWEANGVDLLSLAASLDVPNEAAEHADLKSIPDIWAQFQAFAHAFESGNETARAQWRALIALLALAPQSGKSYEVEVQRVASKDGANAATLRFRSVLAELLPQIRFEPGVGDWKEPFVLTIRRHDSANRRLVSANSQLLGLLNPATLVAVGKNAAELRIDGVAWLSEGLVDPTSQEVRNRPDGLSRRDYEIVARYVDGIRTALLKFDTDAGRATGLLQALLRELQSFAGACRALTGPTPPATKAKDIDALRALPEPYGILAKTFVVDDDDPRRVVSEALIRVRADIGRGADESIKGFILVDRGLPQSLGLPAHDIKIWGQYYLHEALRPGIFETIRSEALAEGYVVVRPEDFFVDELVTFAEGTVVHGHSTTGGFRSAVMPLTPLALLLIGPDGFAQSCKLEIRTNQHEVSLSLTIGNRPHRMRRTFLPEPAAGGFRVAFDEQRTMGLGLWPDFQANDWHWNFLRFANDPKSMALQTRFGTSGQHLVRILNSANPAEREQLIEQLRDCAQCRFSLDTETERVSPHDSPEPVHHLRYTAASAPTSEMLQWSKQSFEAICFSRSQEEGQPAKPAGFILLPSRRAGNTVAGCSIGLDFGTTNTIAYIQGPNEPSPSLLTLNNRVIRPITVPKSEKSDYTLEKWSFVDFMPISENAMPLPTVAKLPSIAFDGDRNLDGIKSLDDDRVLFSSLAFFLPAPQPGVALGDQRFSADAATLSSLQGQLRFGLKWGQTREARNLAKQYLRQLIIMISAELIDRNYDPRQANWRVSYPEALPDPDEFFQTVNAQLSAALGSDMQAEEFTEGGATAAYFLAPQKDPGLVTLVLDIGGGTTDIALWTERKLRWRGSLKLAGGDFFTRFIYNNPDFLSAGLLLRDMAGAIEPSRTSADMLELYFYDRRFDSALNDRYPSIAQEQGAGLRYCALLALGGILYYVGKIAKKLIAEQSLDADIFDGMTVALGGRGSQIFQRFDNATGGRKSRLGRVLGVFSASAGLDPEKYHPNVNKSGQPKSEVAAGMLGDSGALTLARAEPDMHYLPIGETLKVKRNGVTEALAAEIEVSGLLGAEIDGRPQLESIDDFLTLLGDNGGLRINLTDLGRRRIADETSIRLREALAAANEAEAKRRVQKNVSKFESSFIEPPFITALKTMVSLAAQAPAERNKFMEIQENR